MSLDRFSVRADQRELGIVGGAPERRKIARFAASSTVQ
jgi:hypothetical protein